jgi:hypothetical protein
MSGLPATSLVTSVSASMTKPVSLHRGHAFFSCFNDCSLLNWPAQRPLGRVLSLSTDWGSVGSDSDAAPQSIRHPQRAAQSWAFRPTFYPRRYDRIKFFLSPRRRSAAGTRMPRPAHQVVLRHMLVEQSETASTVAGGILDLTADLRRRFSLPCHLDGCQSPSRMTGNALVACGG